MRTLLITENREKHLKNKTNKLTFEQFNQSTLFKCI